MLTRKTEPQRHPLNRAAAKAAPAVPSPALALSALLVLVMLLLAPMARAVEVQRVVSPGGIEAWLVEDHSNPILALDLAFRGGASLDPEGKPGLAYMVSTLIDEGAGPLDSQSFQGELENLSSVSGSRPAWIASAVRSRP